MPKVTVTMGVRNMARYVGAAIESVRAQTLQDWEFILVDDASEDGTPEVIQSYLQDPRIHLVRLDHWSGLGTARNAGFQKAGSPFITMLDGDDAYLPDALELLVNAISQSPSDIGVVYGDHIRLDDATGQKTLVRVVPPMSKPALFRQICCINPVLPSACIMRRQVWEEYGPHDVVNNYSTEFDLWTRSLQTYSIAKIDAPVVVYRRHAEQVTAPAKWAAFRANRDAQVLRIVQSLGLDGLFPEATENFAVASAVDNHVTRMLKMKYPAWNAALFLLAQTQALFPTPERAEHMKTIASLLEPHARQPN